MFSPTRESKFRLGPGHRCKKRSRKKIKKNVKKRKNVTKKIKKKTFVNVE